MLLFGRYNELWIATPDRTEKIKPPTEVAAKHLPNLVIRRMRVVLEQFIDRHEEARRAETAL